MFRCSFCSPKRFKPTQRAFWCTGILHKIVLISGRLDNIEIRNRLPKELKNSSLAQRTEEGKLLNELLVKKVEKLADLGCPKTEELVETQEEVWSYTSYPFRYKTKIHCAEQTAKLFVDWTILHLNLQIL